VTGAAGAPAALDGYCGVLVTRLRECSLLSEGRYNCQNYGDQAELCETSCLEEATCAAVSNYYCGRSGDVLKCFHRCYGLEDFTCQSGEVLSPG